MGECRDEGMNNWRVNGRVSRSPADTYIEWQFEQKCEELANGNDILTEWREKKRQYKSWTDTIVFDFQHFSRHDSSHSTSILEAIEMLLGRDRVDMLSAGDLWLLLECAYIHDIGMTLTYDELLALWEDNDFKKYIHDMIYSELQDDRQAALFYIQMENLIHKRDQMEGIETGTRFESLEGWEIHLEHCLMYLVTDYIRKQHAGRLEKTDKRLPNPENSVIPDRFYRNARIAAVLHGEPDYCRIMEELKECTKGFGNGKMHPRFACAMLRIGDVLDIENNRFNIRSIGHFGNLPRKSEIHLTKHKAITHLKITRSQVEVEAISDDIDVCRQAAEHFNWIDEEVRNLICYWNNLVPEELGGCTLQQSHCQVFYKSRDNLYDAGMKKSIQMDTGKLIELFMGNNIYDSRMEFIREYLQNALDATKMQMWLDIKGKRYRNKMNPGIRDLEELSPLELSKSIFENYPVEIGVSVDWKEQMVKLQIRDNGIGMEKSCISMISQIGQGWRERRRYAEELHRMPDWLRPTGGFGIGIQSAFMASDHVEIITRSRDELTGHKITIESPVLGGYVTNEELDVPNIGTTVRIILKLDLFQTWNNEVEKKGYTGILNSLTYAQKSSKNEADFFDYDNTLDYILSFLKDFVETKVNHRLFPVIITNSQRSDIILGANILPNTNFWENTDDYLIYKNGDTTELLDLKNKIFYGWTGQGSVLYRIDALNIRNSRSNWDKRRINNSVSFKNIAVYHEKLFRIPFMKHLNVAVDVMGGDVKEMLMLNRNAFHEAFDINGWLHALIYKYFTRLMFWYQKTPELVGWAEGYQPHRLIQELFEENAYMALLECVYGGNQWKNEKRNFIADDGISIIRYVWKPDEKENRKPISQKSGARLSDIYFEIQKILGHEDGACVILRSEEALPGISSIRLTEHVSDEELRGDELRYIVSKYLENGGYMIDNKDVSEMMNVLAEAGKAAAIDFSIGRPGDSPQYYKYFTYSVQQTDYEFDEEQFYKDSWEPKSEGQRFVFGMKGKYAHRKLWVDQLPYRSDVKKDAYLISPVSHSIRAQIRAKMTKMKIPWEQFYTAVHDDKSYPLLVQWVADHQAAEEKISKAEIEKEYKEYLKRIYDYNLSDYG